MIFKFNSIIIIIILLFLTGQHAYSQTKKIDSLKLQFYQETSNSQKQETILELCSQFYSMPADSLFKYIAIGEKLVKPNSTDYFKLKIYNIIYLNKKGKFDQSLALCDSLLAMTGKVEITDSLRLCFLSSRCGIYIRNNRQSEAITNAFTLLQQAEQQKDTIAVLKAYILLGFANMELEKYAEAVKWLNKGCYYTTDENILQQAPYMYSNNASCYNNLDMMDSAFKNIDLALKYCRKTEHLGGLANALNIRAAMYQQQGKLSLAEADLQEALIARQKIGDVLDVIADMGQLSSFYAEINQTDKGIAIAQKGVLMAEENNNVSKLIFLKIALAENYRKANDLKNYAATLQNIVDLKDTLYQKNSSEAIAEMQAKYELQQKENIILLQQSNLQRSRYFNIGFSLLFILGLITVWLIYRNYKLIQHRKLEMFLADEKIASFKAIKEAEEKERKRIAADLHDNLGSYAAAITTNVRYLLEDTVNHEHVIEQLDANAKNIVSQLSDTIWVLKNEQLAITQLADRFKTWLQRLIKNYPDVKYFYEEKIETDVAFTPSEILHIFLILKECVNNALKHAGGTVLRIGFYADAEVKIVIEDNGKGFNADDVKQGNGIENIKNRAVQSNWQVQWTSVNPSGTRVTLTATTTN